jgi:hypothetical protein
MKNFLKKIIKSIPIAFMQNQKYDKQTEQIIAKVCFENSNCIDVAVIKAKFWI